MSVDMIGDFYAPVLDCPEPKELARFYCELLGASVEKVQHDDGWVTIKDQQGRRVCFQRSPEHEPPTYPDSKASQQIHFDVLVSDVEAAERATLALGAKRLDGEGGDERAGFRVFADPAGHPFCLVWGSSA